MDFDATLMAGRGDDPLKNQAARLALMSDVVLLISKTEDVSTLINGAIAKIKWVVDFERCTLALLDPSEKSYRLHALIETRPGRSKDSLDDVPIDTGLCGRVMTSGKMLLLSSPEQMSEISVVDGCMQLGEDLATILSVPLQAYGRSLGALTFGSTKEDAYDRDAIDVIRTFATHLALALDRWRYIEVVERANSDLQAEVERRKVAEQDASAAKLVAEEANRAKSTFLANMSHELRTPLNAIIGYSEMLREEAVESEQDSLVPDLDRILGAGKHLLSLINDVLDLSKIEAGRMDLYIETFSVVGMIGDVATTVQPLVARKGNELVVTVDDDVGSMEADLTKVRQILFNLLSNASKFTENGSVALRVVREALDGIDTILFEVEDSGIGMTPDQIDGLFQPFTQADASTTRQFGGTGLGLAISHRFCEMMGGSIQVDSEIGQGSTFLVKLPARTAHTSPQEEPEAQRSAVESYERTKTRPSVLVIDDDPRVLDLMTRFLEKEGLYVETANNGPEGIEKARSLVPGAITLDVLMPGMDGWAVLSQIKADPTLASIPVMMVTIVDDKNLAYSLGASDYLLKPIDRDQLLAALHRYDKVDGAKRVLVVDDDESMRDRVHRTLTKEGWEIQEAEDGREGLAKLEEFLPDVILLDLMMPEFDGFAFLEAVEDNAIWSTIPIVVVTSKDLNRQDHDRLAGRVRRVLEKHMLTMDKLVSEVKALAGSA